MKSCPKLVGALAVCLSLAAPVAHAQPLASLQWEIERNFRYFLYPSDVAAQRVARDLLTARNHAPPTPTDMERFLNGGVGFWSTRLSEAGDARKAWPIDWLRDESSTVYDLIRRLRQDEGRSRSEPMPPSPAETGRLGWASLLTRGPGAATPMGSTDTCWDPAKRLHVHCDAQWGDYVRPVGWVVRVFDPDAPPGETCTWTVEGGAFSKGPLPAGFRASAGGALQNKSAVTATGDCREARIIVPSIAADPADPRRTPVEGKADVQRTSSDGRTARVSVAPRDRLVIGFGDSFTSGEGNPERPARFNGETWSAVQGTPGGPPRLQSSGAASLPARNPDSTTPNTPDTRAQWTDRWCHRSVYSWQIRATLALALRDLHQSVTVLPYGCSGAEILEGLLYAWNGVEYDPAPNRKPVPVVGSRAEIGLAYQELCTPQSYVPTNNLKLNPPTDQDETRPNFYQDALSNARNYVARCNPNQHNAFRRSADALLLDIGINDVQFSKWVMGLILDGSVRKAASGFVPCVDAAHQPCDAATQKMFDRLAQRFHLLSEVFATYLMPAFQIAPDRVIAAVYPPELSGCGAGAGEAVSGNVGLTVTTEDSLFSFGVRPEACDSANLGWTLAGHGAVIAALRNKGDVQSVDNARLLLNSHLNGFASSLANESDPKQAVVLSGFVRAMKDRGFCVTTDSASRPPHGQACFTTADLTDATIVGCAGGDPPSDPESMHAPRPVVQIGAGSCPNAQDISAFHPFPPSRWEAYRGRSRLFRTMNDVYMTINQRPPQSVDTAFGVLDITNRAAGGAFHPTAEGHALVATDAAAELCKALGCE